MRCILPAVAAYMCDLAVQRLGGFERANLDSSGAGVRVCHSYLVAQLALDGLPKVCRGARTSNSIRCVGRQAGSGRAFVHPAIHLCVAFFPL